MPQPPAHTTIGIPFIELQSVDSTNNYLRQLVHENNAEPGTVVFAHEQVAGKGQRGKQWTSEKDANIILSILLNPKPIPLSLQFHLSACIIVSVYEFFSKYAGEETTIKWPNDLYWRDKKAGGVLIENVVRSSDAAKLVGMPTKASASGAGSWNFAIVGIGININQTSFPGDLPNPVSLKQITGKSFDPLTLTKELCGILDKRFHQLIAGGFEIIYQDYLSHLYKKDQAVKLKKESRIFEAMIKTVSPFGKLVTRHGMEEEFEFGEIEWLI